MSTTPKQDPYRLENLKAALEFAKKNPDHPDSTALRKRIESGQLNFELRSIGKPEVPIKTPPITFPKMDQQGGMQSTLPQSGAVETYAKDTIKDIPSDFTETGEKLLSGLAETGQNIVDKATKEDRSLAEKTTMVGGEAIKGIGRFVGNSLIGLGKLALPQSLEDKIVSGVEQFGGKVAEASLDFIQKIRESDHPIDQAVVAKLNELVERYKTDERFRDQVDAGLGFAEGLVELYGTGKAIDVTKEGLEQGFKAGMQGVEASTPIIKEGLETVGEAVIKGQNVIEATAKKTGELVDVVADSRIAKTQARADEAVGRILQGDKASKEAGMRTLREIDSEGIKTYDDLVARIDENIKANTERVDNQLEKDSTEYSAFKLARKNEVEGPTGKQTVYDNAVINALDDLEKYYGSINDTKNSTVIKQYRTKLETKGLTIKEVNEIARKHGADLNAWNANNELSTGLTKQKAENTRSALKDTVRQFESGKATEAIDRQTADMIKTRDQLKEMAEKVNVAEQKARTYGIGTKLWRGAFETADLVTFGGVRGLLGKMNLKAGAKNYDVLELQKNLPKELKAIEKLNNAKDRKSYAEAFVEYVQEAQPGLSIRKTVTPEKVAKNIDAEDYKDIASLIDNPSLRETNDKLGALVTMMGLGKATDDELTSFLKGVIDEYDGVANREIIQK